MQVIEQRFRFLQIEPVEAFDEPAIDRSEEFPGFIPLTLIVPQPRHAHRCAQFVGFGLTRDRKEAAN